MTFASGLFWAHIRWRSSQSPTLTEVLVSEGKTEISDSGLARCVDQDVGGLHVPVDQSSNMGIMQCVRYSGNQFRRVPEGRSSLSDHDCQIAAFDEFRDHEAETVFRTTHVMNRHNVGMAQLGEDFGFYKNRFHILEVGDSFRIWHLDGDGPIQIIVVCKINPPEPTLT